MLPREGIWWRSSRADTRAPNACASRAGRRAPAARAVPGVHAAARPDAARGGRGSTLERRLQPAVHRRVFRLQPASLDLWRQRRLRPPEHLGAELRRRIRGRPGDVAPGLVAGSAGLAVTAASAAAAARRRRAGPPPVRLGQPARAAIRPAGPAELRV